MTIEFLVSEVFPKLRQVASIVSGKNEAQILSSICFTVKGNTMYMTACDREHWLTIATSLVSADEEGSFCIVATDIVSALNNLGEMKVTMMLNEEKQQAICKYHKGKMAMPYESADEFPRPCSNQPTSEPISVSERAMRVAISKCKIAVGHDILRPILNGMHFVFSGRGMNCMATDINEIVHYAQDNSVSMTQEQESFVLSSKTSGILNAIMSDGSVEIRISGTQVVFKGQNYKLTAVLVEGHYPNTDKVLSQEGSIKGKVNKVELIQALIRATAMGEKTNSLVTFDLIGNELTLSSEDVGYNKSSFETISIQTNEHEDLHVGFNGSVLAELLKNHDEDDIPIELSSPKQPIIIRANDSANGSSLVSMLMPLVTLQQMQ